MIDKVRDIEQAEAQQELLAQQISNRKAALAADIGEGNGAMKEAGDPTVMVVIEGRLRVIPVTYLLQQQQQPPPQQAAVPQAATIAAPVAPTSATPVS